MYIDFGFVAISTWQYFSVYIIGNGISLNHRCTKTWMAQIAEVLYAIPIYMLLRYAPLLIRGIPGLGKNELLSPRSA